MTGIQFLAVIPVVILVVFYAWMFRAMVNDATLPPGLVGDVLLAARDPYRLVPCLHFPECLRRSALLQHALPGLMRRVTMGRVEPGMIRGQP